MSPAALLSRRSRALRLLLLVVFAALVIRLVMVQEISHGHYAALSSAELTQTVPVPAVRGGIYDRNGEVLAESVTKQTVVADPYLIKDPGAMAAKLGPVLGIPAAQLRSLLTENSGFVYLAHRVADATAAKVTAMNLTGINLVPESQRVLPDGGLASPVIGTVGSDGTGLSGLEYQYQSLLAGQAGTRSLLESPGGVALPGAAASPGKAAKPGTGLELTIDSSLQFVAEQALGAEIVASHAASGIAIVMDVKTGDILAMANLQAAGSGTPAVAPASGSASAAHSGPTYAPSVTTLPAGVTEASSNLALTQVYEPGSVFKLVTFSASLQDGVITPNTAFTVPGALPLGNYVFHDAESHGTETLTATQIIARSSNIGTIEITEALGKDRFLAQLANLGFGKPTGLNFPGESQGLIPTRWTASAIGSTPIGQDDAVTAQQLLDAYNAAANGGVMVAPRLVRATVSPSGVTTATPPSPTRRVISAAADAELIPMLERVVTSPNGTGNLAAIDGYAVAGKTGTSQIPNPNAPGYLPGQFYATFCGFAPAQHPVLSAVVILKQPTPVYGGSVSAPVFSTIMEYALHHYGIPTTITATPSAAAGAVGGTGSTVVLPAATA